MADEAMDDIVLRYRQVVERVANACERSGRSLDEVTIVAVSKTVDAAAVANALQAGIRNFGENRPDALASKAPLFPSATWHFIGNIQSRRIKDIVGHVSLIHSVDRLELLSPINAQAVRLGTMQDVLLEVNVSGEKSKSGFVPEKVKEALEEAMTLPAIRVKGLMTMAPQGDLLRARATFSGLRCLRDELCERVKGTSELLHLSMGMSEDFEIAIEEGATIVRVGRSIFGGII